ncbi:MAG: M20 family metallopeptidase [Neisseria sp.]|nr:M20 family metallopeptidase [Neisseria sp.]
MNTQNLASHLALSDEDFAYLSRIRRQIHQNPELAFEEFQTSQLVQNELASFGIEVQTGFAGTGVVGILRGDLATENVPVIALRADMDALPIAEQTGAAFASQKQGLMHACGHDAHTAMLLTAAKILVRQRHQLAGVVKFIFQPAEEMKAGGKKLIADGALANPKPDWIYGFHVWPDLPVGKIGLRQGALMASMDSFEITLTGMSGHAAAPHQGIDAMLGGAHLITALQSIVSREVNPLDSAVVSVGSLISGTASNIIADTAKLTGNIRTIHPQTRQNVLAAFERVVAGVAHTFRLQHQITYLADYPVTLNHPAAIEFAEQVLEENLGADVIAQIEQPSMASEDFAYYLEQIEGAFLFLGVNDGAGGAYKLHHECFLPDESALVYGVNAFVALVNARLRQ